MNIKQLRFASAVSKIKSFNKAAQLCHVTQPTLSNAIAQLESELENRLFERTTRAVSLTPFGKQILPLIDRAISGIDEVITAAESWRDPTHKLIRLGLSPVVDMRVLQTILAPFSEKNPDVKFFYKECYLDDLDERLKEGQLDIVLMPSQILKAKQQHIVLYDEPLCYLPRQGGDIDNTEGSVFLSDTAQENLILTIDGCGLRSVTLDLLHQHDIPFEEYPGQATSYAVVEEWAEIGIGAGILPQSKISATNKSARPLVLKSGEPARIRNVAFWNSSAANVNHIQAFIHHLETSSQTINSRGQTR